MANVAARFMLTVPVEMAKKAEALKKDLFYDKPYAEMYRQLIRLGMDEIQKKEEKEIDANRRFGTSIYHEIGMSEKIVQKVADYLNVPIEKLLELAIENQKIFSGGEK